MRTTSPTPRRLAARATLALVLLLGGCSGGGAPDAGDAHAPLDARPDAREGGGAMCAGDAQCDDGLFCTGVERCSPGAAGADARGCVAGSAPCPAGQACMESARTCSGGCPDMDGDGHTAMACGGDDCDDSDPHRFPGNTEVCGVAMATGGDAGVASCDGGAGGAAFTRTDPAAGLDPTHDEDCDPTTYANAATHDGDHDGDGFVDSACCNTDRSGGTHCGDDCDDLAAVGCVAPRDIHPSAPEVCDGADNNCNGMVDEGVGFTFYPDCDHDGVGDTAHARPALCMAPSTAPSCPAGLSGTWVTVGGDCDDACAAAHPGGTEVCDGCDDDCNGTVDDPAAANASCVPMGASPGPNQMGWACASSGRCVVACNAGFADCDMSAADGCEVHTAADASNCGACHHACNGLTCQASACVATITQLDGGSNHTCARRATGTVACWGANNSAQLGNGRSGMDSAVPVTVSGVTDATQVAAGSDFACALRASGAVVCWGNGFSGQLGNGATATSAVPVTVSGLTDATQVSANSTEACARRASGAVVCWGNNVVGELGNGSTTNSSVPVTVSGLTDATQVSVGQGHVCARRASGAVVCWGSDSDGQLGNGTSGGFSSTPVAVLGLSDAINVAAGSSHVCARRASGAVVCWGYNAEGQLGNGTRTSSSTPVAVSGLTDAAEISTENAFTCARRVSGAVVCWGDNGQGELGDPMASGTSSTPVAVSGLTDATTIGTGENHVCARRASGAVVCWGDNGHGQLGDGTTTDRTTPVPLLDP